MSDLQEIYDSLCKRAAFLTKHIGSTDMNKYTLETIKPQDLVSAYEILSMPCTEGENIYNATIVINTLSKIHANLELGFLNAQIRSVEKVL
jgi:hypothetical protein